MQIKMTAVSMALAGAVLLMGGCVPSEKIGSVAASQSAAEESPRAFYFESGVLEFGDFDPYSLGNSLFNPCTEITPEEYAAAGFPEIIVKDEGRTFHGLNTCHLPRTEEQLDKSVTVSFANGNTTREMIEFQGLLYPEYRSDLIPELFTFAANDASPGVCYVQIDTARGGFGASAGGDPRDVTTEEMCNAAIDIVEQLYRAFGSPDVH
ncbi:DUF3558 family protein [Corynebacterium riegelii]|uniref:DUF3558 family protein n=1 Tax=Corynebacterium riegelii TaxID=156976 RepID=UPI00288960EF|nr:DUF3558 family protein [Corynebacterium riegelii]